jgi:hypothetical protein
MKATTDKEATDKRATGEAVVKVVMDKEGTDKRIVLNEAADKEVADKRAAGEATLKDATVGAVGDSSAPGQVSSSVSGTKRVAVPSGSTPLAKRPYRGIWKLWFV